MILKNISAKSALFLSQEILYSFDGSTLYKSDREGAESVKIDFLDDLKDAKLKYNKETLVYLKANHIKVIYLPSQRTVLDKKLPDGVSSFCISASGMNIAVGFNNGGTIIFNSLLGDSLGKFALFSSGNVVEHIGFLDDALLVGATKTHIRIISLLKRGEVSKITSESDIKKVYLSSDKLLYSTTTNELYFVDLENPKNPKKNRLENISFDIVDLQFSNDNKTIFLASKDTLFFMDLTSQKLTRIRDGFDVITTIAVDEKGSLYIATESATEFIINPFDLESDTAPANMQADNIVRFLTVDDSTTMRLVIKKSILNNFKNVEVAEAVDGLEALEYLTQHPNTDVLFLDWNMPNMNGDQVVEEIAKREELKHIKIIMATTEGGKERVKEMISKGVIGYLVKPLKPGSVNPLAQKIIEMVQEERSANV